MAKLSGDTLLQRAIEPGINDRVSLAESYGRGEPEHARFHQEAESFRTLIGKKLKSLTPAERKVAFAVFLSAEQWEESLADANHRKGPFAAECLRNVRLFREFRHAEWGRTQMEAFQAEATAVDIRDLVDEPNRARAKP